MSNLTPRQYGAQAHEEACEWFVEFRTGEPDERQRRRFYAWLQESPANVAAYLDVAKTWVQAGSQDIAQKYPAQELIASAINANNDAVPIGVSDFPIRTPVSVAAEQETMAGRKMPFGRMSRIAMAASIAIFAGVLALLLWRLQDVKTYSTAVGEHHFIVLRDGSMINLNSRSRVRVQYTSRERRVDLLEGQALFSVTKDPARPFIVYSGAAQVKAVGTEFDVYRKATGTIVTVIEGRVAVVATADTTTSTAQRGRQPARPEPNLVSAGEQLTIAANAAPRLATLDVSNAVNWTQGRLVFASTPLKEVAEEFNRYNARQIVIADPDLEQFEIDGVFSSTEVDALLQFLRRRSDMSISESDGNILVRSR